MHRCMRHGQCRWDAAMEPVHHPRVVVCLGMSHGERMKLSSRALCGGGDVGSCPRPSGGVGRFRECVRKARVTRQHIIAGIIVLKKFGLDLDRHKHGLDPRATPRERDPDLPTLSLLATMSIIAHGVKTLGVIGAGQMGMFASFALLSTYLPIPIQDSVLPT